jgi:FtsP/CotA-like multicopper oxidase with cupredoxin domain
LNWIGASTFKTLGVSVDEHPMWIYEVDGQYIEPRRADTFLIWAGERYSAMIRLDKEPKDYSIRIPDGGYSQIISGFGTLRYRNGRNGNEAVKPDLFNVNTTSTPFLDYNGLTLNNATSLDKIDLPPFPPTPPGQHGDDMHVLYLGKANSTWQFTMSGKSMYTPERTANNPLLFYPNSTDGYNSDLVIRTKNGTWVDLVLQVGWSPDWKVDFPHAIHKHANKYWRIGSGVGMWNYSSVAEAISEKPSNFNLINPPYRDTFLTDFTGAMWLVLRYQVTSPGAWMLHCHFEQHLVNGMGMAVLDGVDAWPIVPPEYRIT